MREKPDARLDRPATSSDDPTIFEVVGLQVSAVAVSNVYTPGTLLGDSAGLALFGALIQARGRNEVVLGYFLGYGLMIGAAVV